MIISQDRHSVTASTKRKRPLPAWRQFEDECAFTPKSANHRPYDCGQSCDNHDGVLDFLVGSSGFHNPTPPPGLKHSRYPRVSGMRNRQAPKYINLADTHVVYRRKLTSWPLCRWTYGIVAVSWKHPNSFQKYTFAEMQIHLLFSHHIWSPTFLEYGRSSLMLFNCYFVGSLRFCALL